MTHQGSVPPLSATPPETIGPYRILGILGEGGMGVVYEAEDMGPVRRRVALKIVRAGLNTRDVMARFDAERQALALMSHAGIAQVYSAGATAAGEPYFAMELVRGLPLTEYCDSRRLTMRQRLDLFMAVCHAVQHAHQKGVVHRDLKPSNIIVTEQDGTPQPKIIDFGIAKALGQQLTTATLVTHVGVALGTAAYMSPEQAESSGLDVDTRTDIYTLGVILYEMLVGRLPIEPRGEGVHLFLARLAARETDPPTPSSLFTTLGEHRQSIARMRQTDPESLRRELQGDLDWVVMKAMDADRSRRYASAAGLAADVARHLADEPVVARPPSARYRFGKFVRRHRVAVPATLLAVLAIAASAAFAIAGMIRATEAEQRATHEAAATRQVSEFLVDLFHSSVQGDPSGDQLTARGLLDRGAQRANVSLSQQPVLQGRVMLAIGRAYAALGLYDSARVQLELALAARTSVDGANSVAVADVETALGEAATLHGDFDAADRHLTRALRVLENAPGGSRQALARARGSIGALRWRQGHLAEADSSYRRALASDQAPGGDSLQLAKDLQGLGIVTWQRKRFAEAEPLLRQSLRIRELLEGPNNPDVAAARNNLGVSYWSRGRYAEALELFQQAYEVLSRARDSTHPMIAQTLNNIAETYWKLKRYREAEPLFRRSLAIKEQKLTAGDPYIATTLYGLGNVLMEEGKFREAEPLLRRALAIRESALKPGHSDITESATALAALLRRTGRSAEAEQLEGRLAAKR